MADATEQTIKQQTQLMFACQKLVQQGTLDKNEQTHLKDLVQARHEETMKLFRTLDPPNYEQFAKAVKDHLAIFKPPADSGDSKAKEEKKKFRPSGIQVQKQMKESGKEDDAHRRERALNQPKARQSTGLPVHAAQKEETSS